MRGYAVSLLRRMLETYSPTGRESELAELLAREMEALGYDDIKVDEVGNVVARVGQGRPRVLLCGHMDTVPGKIRVREVDGKLYGRGAVDAKSALATLILSCSRAAELGISGEALVACVVDEEGASKGVRHLMKTLPEIDYAIFGEPSGADSVTIAYKGSLTLSLAIRGKGGHSSAPWAHPNPLEKALEIWLRIKEARLGEERESRFESVSKALLSLKSYSRGNSIPHLCRMRLNIRFPPSEKPSSLLQRVEAVLEEAGKGLDDLSVEWIVEELVEGYVCPRNSPLIRAFIRAILDVFGKPARLVRKTGTADLNILATRFRIPMVAYGPGSSSLDHTPFEHLSIEEYLKAIDVCTNALTTLLS